MKRIHAILLPALFFLLFASPARAIDPTVNIILDIALQELAPEIKPAKPFIVCLIDGGSVESCLESFLSTYVNKLLDEEKSKLKQKANEQLDEIKKSLPFDPSGAEIQTVLQIVKAAMEEKWEVVISKGGPYLLRTILCAAFIPPGAKSFTCPVIGYVLEFQFSLVKEVLEKVKNNDFIGLIKILISKFGIELVCELIPEDELPSGVAELTGLACGVVGKIIGGMMDLFESAAKWGLNAADDVWDFVTGGNGFMPYKEYFEKYWRPLHHYGTRVCLDSGCGNLNNKLSKKIYDDCVKYYDEHDHWVEQAEKVCNGMRNVFEKEVGKIAAAMQAASNVYANQEAPKWAKHFALLDWAEPKDRKPNFRQMCINDMTLKFPFPPTNKKPPVTAWEVVCNAPADKFAPLYMAEQQKIAEIVKKLEPYGCKKSGASPVQRIACDNYAGFDACNSAYDGKLPCTLDEQKAKVNIIEQLLNQLGTKRCRLGIETTTKPCAKNSKYEPIGSCTYIMYGVFCSRPWKVDKCKELLSDLTAGHTVHDLVCKEDAAGMAEFIKMEKQASAIRNLLNGIKPVASAPIVGSKKGTDVVWSIGGGSCKTGKPDTLRIHCPGGEFDAHPQISLPSCPLDPKLDGADVPCREEVFKFSDTLKPGGKLSEVKPGGIYQQGVPGVGAKPPLPLPPATGKAVKPLPPPMMSAPPLQGAPAVLTPPAIPSMGSGQPGTGLAPKPAQLPAGDGTAAPATNVPGCTAVPSAPGQFLCLTREAYATCERMRIAGKAGVRACQVGGARPIR